MEKLTSPCIWNCFLQRNFKLQRAFHSWMSNEELLVAVDQFDKTLGPVGKLRSHQKGFDNTLPFKEKYNATSSLFSHTNINFEGETILHRAFSIFHFSSDGHLLLTQRSASKLTFPLQWTNTCCSHPNWSTLEERGTKDGNADTETINSVKKAASRRMNEELGLKIHFTKFQFITRLMYYANTPGPFAEYEMDYIFTSLHDKQKQSENEKVDNLFPNEKEVNDFEWLGKEAIQSKMAACTFTPWSLYILKKLFIPNWEQLSSGQAINSNIKDKINYAGNLTNF